MNFKRALTRKVGPLAAGWWLAILAGALLLYRQFRGAASTPADTTSSTDTGAAAAAGYGTPTVAGGGGADSGLQPDQPSAQTFADEALSGPGTAVIFDPLSSSATDTGGGPDGLATFTGFGPPPHEAFDVNQGQDPVLGGSRSGIGRTPPTARPKSTRGQKAPEKKAKPVAKPAPAHTAPVASRVSPTARVVKKNEKKKLSRPRGAATQPVSVARIVQPHHAGLAPPPVIRTPTPARSSQIVTRTPAAAPTPPPTLPTPETRPPARITRPIAV